MDATDAPLIALIAGETSGDLLGAGLIEALRRRWPDARFIGVGGERIKRLCPELSDGFFFTGNKQVFWAPAFREFSLNQGAVQVS